MGGPPAPTLLHFLDHKRRHRGAEQHQRRECRRPFHVIDLPLLRRASAPSSTTPATSMLIAFGSGISVGSQASPRPLALASSCAFEQKPPAPQSPDDVQCAVSRAASPAVQVPSAA